MDRRLIRSQIGRIPKRDEAFWTEIEGDSMAPWIKNGEYVFCLREDTVTVPDRYVVWWGKDEGEICLHLTKASEQMIIAKKYGPEKEWEMRHRKDDLYEISNGDTVRMQVRGRVVWPTSTPQSVMETVTDQMGKVLEKALNSG